MAKDPAFLFYSSDFLAGVSDLTMEERGQYITLLCIHHQKGRLTKKTIDLCVGNATADVLAKFRQDDAGLFFNERLEMEIEKRKAHSKKQSERAKDGWEKRKNNATAYTTADATALPLENENVIEDENENTDKNEKYLIPQILKNWYETFPTYTKSKKDDYPAVLRIINFMIEQHALKGFGDDASKEKIKGTFEAIADQIKQDQFWINKPLKSIANNIQEFYNKIKNPSNGKKSSNIRDEVQHAFDKRYGK